MHKTVVAIATAGLLMSGSSYAYAEGNTDCDRATAAVKALKAELEEAEDALADKEAVDAIIVRLEAAIKECAKHCDDTESVSDDDEDSDSGDDSEDDDDDDSDVVPAEVVTPRGGVETGGGPA